MHLDSFFSFFVAWVVFIHRLIKWFTVADSRGGIGFVCLWLFDLGHPLNFKTRKLFDSRPKKLSFLKLPSPDFPWKNGAPFIPKIPINLEIPGVSIQLSKLQKSRSAKQLQAQTFTNKFPNPNTPWCTIQSCLKKHKKEQRCYCFNFYCIFISKLIKLKINGKDYAKNSKSHK